MKDEVLDIDLDATYDKNNTVSICSAIMGAGKTVGISEWMNNNRGEYSFMYISPLLSEVEERIQEACPKLDFTSPSTENHKTKSEHLLDILAEGSNVAFTHKLFEEMTDKHLDAIYDNNYVLIMDEEIDMLEPYASNYESEDIDTLLKDEKIAIDTEDLGRVIWKWQDTFVDGSTYTKLKNICNMGMLHVTTNQSGKKNMMVLHMPVKLVKACSKVIVLSYMFKDGIMDKYLEMKGLNIEEFDLGLGQKSTDKRKQAKDLIQIMDTDKPEGTLGSMWYKRRENKSKVSKVVSKIRSICRKYKSDEVAYTLPKHVVDKDSKVTKTWRINGYSPEACFIPCNIRATNKYANKSVLIHAYNRYAQVAVVSYLKEYGYPIDDDKWACSELVQWIYRSRVRKDEPVKIYFLCQRMENLLKDWLEGDINVY